MKNKSWRRIFVVLGFSIVVPVLLLAFGLIDFDGVILQGSGFHYNSISMSAIIGGFLFTGISILVTAIDKVRIKRLWENNYLDNLYRAAFIGMAFNIITILSSFSNIIFKLSICFTKALISIEIVSIISGIIFFAWCIKQLIFIIIRTKND